MKKNKMMRLASALLVLVLLTTCAISGTFAKYVSAGGSSDSARVAKWGVTVSADYSGLFSETYTTDVAWTGDDGNSVVSSVRTSADPVVAGEDVIAPGTSGTLADFTVAGTPEVDVYVSYEATLTLTGWEVDENEYCPIIITVNDVKYYIGATVGEETIDTVAELKDAVEAAIEDSAKYYNANTNLGDAANVTNDLAVSWAWEFEANTLATYQTDVKDTALGDAAADSDAATIELAVTCTITQVN